METNPPSGGYPLGLPPTGQGSRGADPPIPHPWGQQTLKKKSWRDSRHCGGAPGQAWLRSSCRFAASFRRSRRRRRLSAAVSVPWRLDRSATAAALQPIGTLRTSPQEDTNAPCAPASRGFRVVPNWNGSKTQVSVSSVSSAINKAVFVHNQEFTADHYLGT